MRRTFFGLGFVIVASTTSYACGDSSDGSSSDGSSSGNSSSGTTSSSSGTTSSSSGTTSSSGTSGASSGTSGASSGTSGSTSGGVGAHCAGLPMNCGGANDCCAVGAVPGGKYDRSDDPQYAATVSAFKLDVYEVTLGRFRTFVNAGKGTQASPPAANDGAHPKIANSGWQTAFNASLETDTATLKAALSCDPQAPVWTDTPGANENKPINCVTWYEALAFCAWDGGRLPTEAEWNFAASGGADQRAYPWGADINQSKAAYDCGGKGQGKCVFGDLLNVGSKSPAGDGKYGQADLGGNVWEYVLDYFVEPYAQKTCNDCADLTPSANRGFRGGGYGNDGYYLHSLVRLGDTPLQRDYDVGIRCARD